MKINDYVRTKEGIHKIVEMRENRFRDEFGNITFYDEIIKSSPNLIDLIEVGDYVNGYYVENIRERYDGEIITIIEVATGSNYFQTPLYDEDIKSILTHEQFEREAYMVNG